MASAFDMLRVRSIEILMLSLSKHEAFKGMDENRRLG
jgi:hypothetical protein